MGFIPLPGTTVSICEDRTKNFLLLLFFLYIIRLPTFEPVNFFELSNLYLSFNFLIFFSM